MCVCVCAGGSNQRELNKFQKNVENMMDVHV